MTKAKPFIKWVGTHGCFNAIDRYLMTIIHKVIIYDNTLNFATANFSYF